MSVPATEAVCRVLVDNLVAAMACVGSAGVQIRAPQLLTNTLVFKDLGDQFGRQLVDPGDPAAQNNRAVFVGLGSPSGVLAAEAPPWALMKEVLVVHRQPALGPRWRVYSHSCCFCWFTMISGTSIA